MLSFFRNRDSGISGMKSPEVVRKAKSEPVGASMIMIIMMIMMLVSIIVMTHSIADKPFKSLSIYL